GFAINHIEVAIDHFFGLRGWPDEYTELDTRALLRVAYKDRIEGLARGVQTAIYTPNEARRSEDLPDADGGDEPRVQQQQVPLDWGGFEVQPPAPTPPAAATPPASDAPPAPTPADDSETTSVTDFFERGINDYAERKAACTTFSRDRPALCRGARSAARDHHRDGRAARGLEGRC